AGETEVRIYDGDRLVARHRRSYEAKKVVEDPAHVEALAAEKRAAQPLKGRDRLRAAVPELEGFLRVLAERGESLGYHTVRLLRLLDLHGVDALRVAVSVAVERGAYASGAVAHILDQQRRAEGLTPPVEVALPKDPRVSDLRINNHSLEDYDGLSGTNDHPDA
ncbi:MAG: IS21 family transposase, partial [Deltaproteobacteria bacterium]|nr:IS21 family transposase [Deltaproteobacteria bacterium]